MFWESNEQLTGTQFSSLRFLKRPMLPPSFQVDSNLCQIIYDLGLFQMCSVYNCHWCQVKKKTQSREFLSTNHKPKCKQSSWWSNIQRLQFLQIDKIVSFARPYKSANVK
jgi:hypothetical protein